ncbi:MAG: DUF6754 domain-containing protein [bacterium]|nr:DUF6754 domain-containing protein [bacterium]
MSLENTQFIAIFVLVIVFAVVAVTPRFRGGTKRPLRRIRAYESIPAMVGDAIEADRPIHLSLGSAGVGGDSTLLAISSAELTYYVAQQATIGDSPPIVTVSNPLALPLAQDTLRRAYHSRGLDNRFSGLSARWYPNGQRSLAFAAGITAMTGVERPAAHVLVGSYGIELALILMGTSRRRATTIAGSDQLDGQAIAYVLADAPLIGEELFVSNAYLGDVTNTRSETTSLDLLRWVVILTMLGGLVVSIINRGG